MWLMEWKTIPAIFKWLNKVGTGVLVECISIQSALADSEELFYEL